MPPKSRWKRPRLGGEGGGGGGGGSGTGGGSSAAKDLGLKVVAEGIDPIVDIVAIHGLNGHRERTWTAENGTHWLRDLLPVDIPKARIMCWGYDADTHSRTRVSCLYLYDHARELISELSRKRQLTDSTRRPIIFVAHSLGGIVLKSALIHSDSARPGALPEHRSIKISTYGIIFLGTPHQGVNGVRFGRLLVNIASVAVTADDHLLRHLERDSEWLQQQLGQYGPISNSFVTKFAYEQYETATKLGHKMMVVPRASAVVPGQADAEAIVIHADHVNMVRFASMDDSGYTTISEHLQIMLQSASDRIHSQWAEETRVDAVPGNSALDSYSLPISFSGVSEVPTFVAREEELSQIHGILHKAEGRRIAVLQGLGGMGKTQLALKYSSRYHADYSSVIWFNARDKSTLQQSFLVAAKWIAQHYPKLAHVENAMTAGDLSGIVRIVRDWLDEKCNNRWLLIFDNYDDPKLDNYGDASQGTCEPHVGTQREQAPNENEYDIRPFFPHRHDGAIIVTTRSSAVELGNMIQIRKLQNIDDSLAILESTSGRQNLKEENDALELAKKLDGLPLALATAGSYLKQVSTTWTKYLELYETSWLHLQKASPQLATYDCAMYSTWNISYEHIKRQDPNAAALLKLWAYFDNEDLWLELLSEGRSIGLTWLDHLTENQLGFDQSMRILCSHGLVDPDPQTKECGAESRGYSIHGCVHAWMICALSEPEDTGLGTAALTCVALHVPHGDEEGSWMVRRRLLRHADRCKRLITESAREEMQEAASICHNLGLLYRYLDRFDDAEVMYKMALQSHEKLLGPDHMFTLYTARHLGILYSWQNRFHDAEQISKRVLRAYEKVLGSGHEKTISLFNDLGNLYGRYGWYDHAEAMFKRAIEGFERIHGPNHESTLIAAAGLGRSCLFRGHLHEAENMFNRALEGLEKELPPNHQTLLRLFEDIGCLYRSQGRFGEAEVFLEHVHRTRETTLGPNHTETLNAVYYLACVYGDQGRLEKAQAMFARVLQHSERIFGHSNASTLEAVYCMGVTHERQGRFREAKTMYERAYQGYTTTLGSEHTNTLRAAEALRRIRGVSQLQ